jgi:hypothetical protein
MVTVMVTVTPCNQQSMTSSGLPREEPGPAEKLNKLPVPAVISSLQKQRDDLG